MDDKREKRSAPVVPLLVVAVVLFLLLPLLYALSLGPAIWLCQHGYIDINAAQTFYYPLEKLADEVPLFHNLINRYAQCFVKQ